MSAKLAKTLRTLREQKRMSQSHLARVSGVGRLTIGKIEAGEGNPKTDTLMILAKALGVPLSTLIGDEEPRGTIPEDPAKQMQQHASEWQKQAMAEMAGKRADSKLDEIHKEIIRGFARLEALIGLKK